MTNSNKSSVNPELKIQVAQELLDRRQARKNLLSFTTYTMPRFRVNWHHSLICHYLDQVSLGGILRLMIFLPPRHSKSQLVSRHFPAYVLGRFPDTEIIACSYSDALASRMNRDVQRLMSSVEYQRLFPKSFLSLHRGKSAQSQRTSHLFEIPNHRGIYRSAGVGGGITGMGFSVGIIDDPVKNAQEARSPLIREKIWEWYHSTFWTRQGPDARIILTMTRWHPDDLAGRLLDRSAKDSHADQWTILSLPAISENTSKISSPQNELHCDPRAEGEALWPERYPIQWLQQARVEMGSLCFAAMFQQRPTPQSGNIFQESWFLQYQDRGSHWSLGKHGLMAKADVAIFSIMDPATSEKESADYTAIGVFALTPTQHLLILDMIRERLGIEQIIPRLERMVQEWNPQWIGIESTGFQMALVRDARSRPGMPPIRELKPEGKGKLARSTDAVIRAEAGQIWIPDRADWLEDFLSEITQFTGKNDRHDDQVDVVSYAALQCKQFYGVDTTIPEIAISNPTSAGLWGL